MLNVLVDLDLSDWEEKITAASFLAGKDISTYAFSNQTLKKVIEALEQLTAFPQVYVKELCLELLLREQEESC